MGMDLDLVDRENVRRCIESGVDAALCCVALCCVAGRGADTPRMSIKIWMDLFPYGFGYTHSLNFFPRDFRSDLRIRISKRNDLDTRGIANHF